MEEHPIEGLMTTAMENLKTMVEVNTIIGNPVNSPDGSVIIPVSKLGFGFASGGSEFTGNQQSSSDSQSDSEATLPFGGGSGGGAAITPVAFLIINTEGIKMVHLDQSVHLYEKMIDYAPEVVDKIQQMVKEVNLKNESSGDEQDNSSEGGKRKRSNKRSQYDI